MTRGKTPFAELCALFALFLAAGCEHSTIDNSEPEEFSSETPVSSEEATSSEEALSSSAEALPDSVTVTVACGENGSCSPDGAVRAARGDSLRIRFDADERRFVSSVVVDGETETLDTLRVGSFWTSFADLSADHSVSVSFGRDMVWVDCGKGGTCSPRDTTPGPDDAVLFVFRADSGNKVGSYSRNGELVFDGTGLNVVVLTDTLRGFREPRDLGVSFIRLDGSAIE